MHRFYLPPDQCRGSMLRLAGREAYHALRVLRVRPGEQVVVLDGAGQEFRCQVQDVDRSRVLLAVVQQHCVPLPSCRITLLQAIPKGKLIESIIQKATELGVSRLVPLLSERVNTRMDDSGAGAKAEKWRLVAIEAVKQCGTAWLPRVETPMTPQQFLARQEKIELPLIASLTGPRRHPRDCFREFQAHQGRLPQSACVWIGPEGDFTPDEIGAITAGGAMPITLGQLVLRTETAAVYCLSILNYELQTGGTAL